MDTTVSRIKQLAKEQGRSLSYLCRQIGMSSRTYFTDIERSGRTIPADKIKKLARIFDVSADYLLCQTDEKGSYSESGRLTLSLTGHEIKLINAYRSQPSMQTAVDKLLGLSESDDEYVSLYVAAHSDDNRQDAFVVMNKDQWKKIENAPETDDPLM
ncbi:MAG: helix-turn-helix transcriptional regulator [Clostridia bacterium]|nr:helix-turn-helix transcriptional regulator [Clostridia bacterium]